MKQKVVPSEQWAEREKGKRVKTACLGGKGGIGMGRACHLKGQDADREGQQNYKSYYYHYHCF